MTSLQIQRDIVPTRLDVPAPPRRPRLRLSVRALMIFVLLAGGGSGWIVYRARVQRQAVAAIQAAGGHVFYHWDETAPGRRQPWLSWLVNRLGPDYFGDVTAVFLTGVSGARADDALMGHIGRLIHLEQLEIPGNIAVTDAGLLHLRGLERLMVLNLNATGVRGPGLASSCARCSRLETLRLEGLPVADDDVAHLSGMTSLVCLSLSGERITDDGLSHLKGLVNLQSLGIACSHVTAAGLIHLQNLKRLTTFSLISTQVSTLKPLARLTAIHHLGLVSNRIDDAGLAPIAAFVGLKTLVLSEPGVSDLGLAHIADFEDLAILHLNETPITDAGLARLSGLTKCRQMNVAGTRIRPAGMAALTSKLPMLRVTNLAPGVPEAASASAEPQTNSPPDPLASHPPPSVST